MVTLSPKGL
ncbi:hypothetical protein GQ607_016591 [Colletotrichum asianum]|uniref:Uncharacterized protein n=1 Tax=Colletotrichum asianum TaxID=702518 RepID=A0A8H3ZJU3_9PEZI|nr:hypothetical protein GQ607_016591 [Colletotrichum asianum]